jgi:hypothetical protein
MKTPSMIVEGRSFPRRQSRRAASPRAGASYGVPHQGLSVVPRLRPRLSCFPESVWQVGGASGRSAKSSSVRSEAEPRRRCRSAGRSGHARSGCIDQRPATSSAPQSSTWISPIRCWSVAIPIFHGSLTQINVTKSAIPCPLFVNVERAEGRFPVVRFQKLSRIVQTLDGVEVLSHLHTLFVVAASR